MISVISSFAILAIAALITLILKNNRNKGILAISAICTAAVFTSITAVLALTGQSFQYQFYAGAFLGNVRLCMDGLSAWFSLIISLVFSLGAFYGWGYMQHYLDKKNDIGMHIFAYLMAYLSMQALCVLQHSLAFLLAWEIMALSSFVLIIFESWKADVIKAGINFFIQSHVSVVLLTIGFLMMSAQSGSFDFNSFASLSAKQANTAYVLLFLGFAVKAGLLPFHTWLPHAHPAAPAHISGVMSGVIIKIGIFGMLRMLSFAPIHYEGMGYLVLTLAAISGLYGIMQAIVQKNIKKLLAYSSIENIGIICMGIGLGLIGVGSGQSLLTYLGFAAALLHTLNHALFKSSLFFLAGNVYHATHSLNMEQMGGLGKKMPWTCLFFLLGSVAICALPPMNGFVSEFMLYNGLFRWMQEASLTGAVGASFAILALVLIGGLAIICFTKVFGITFLGTARSEMHEPQEMPKIRLIPIAISLGMMLCIGLCPWLFNSAMQAALANLPQVDSSIHSVGQEHLAMLSLVCICFLSLVIILYLLRNKVQSKQNIRQSETWGCGYTAATPKIQYTGASYVKTYSDTLDGLIGFDKQSDIPTESYPQQAGEVRSESFDQLEHKAIEKPLRGYQWLMSHFLFLQNGKLQFYMLYGIIFILITIILTFIVH
ncbi:MAG: hypothetical protein J6Q25_03225 [Bacteroidales bacterium]|nr:hypothetical protein [Bacteroidales bacterium]